MTGSVDKFSGIDAPIATRRKVVIVTLASPALALIGGRAAAQQKFVRLGYLSNAFGRSSTTEALQKGLRELGYVEGRNLVIEWRFAEGQLDRLPNIAAELVRLKVDLIVVSGGQPALAARSATTTMPIVMANAGDPVAFGLVASLGRPGGNVTGLSSLVPELNSKRLEILKEAVPKLARVGLLAARARLEANTGLDLQLKELRAAALALKLKLEEIETQLDAKGLENAFQTAKQKQVGAIITTADRSFLGERKRIVELAGKYHLPAIYPQKAFVQESGLMSYGVDFAEQYRRAAVYVDKILKGAKPADLPVQQATKFEFVINLKAAKEIGLTIPANVLERANQVIK